MDHENGKDFKFSEDPTLEKIREMQAGFCRERDWDQFHSPRNMLLALVGEVGELSEIFQWKETVNVGLPDFSEQEKIHVSEELSDVLINLVRLAERCRIDLPAAVLRNIQQNPHRDSVPTPPGTTNENTECGTENDGKERKNSEKGENRNYKNL